ncbi:MAG: hypothetical protein V4481_00655 [Patescibacteria group bacterium]
MENQNNQAAQPSQPSPAPVQAVDNHTILGVLSYLGPLVIVSYLMGKDIPFIKFHAKQGLVLFGIEIIVWILGSVSFSFWMILNIVNLATLVLSIIGIINVIQHKEKELPLVGSLSRYIKM